MSKPEPNKIVMKMFPEMVGHFKKYNCKNYETCIDLAIEQNWPQFHCNACTAYVKDEAQPELDLSEDFDINDYDETYDEDDEVVDDTEE